MESTINLDQSDFKRLIDRSGSTSSPGGPNSVKNLIAQIRVQFGGHFNFPGKVDDYVEQLLARPSTVRLIDKFIDGWMEGDLSLASKKNAAKSVDFRNRGNREYGRRNFTQAAYLYTMAIVYAPNVNENDDVSKDNVLEELSLAFGNRSAVFYELGLYGACLDDIEHALATGYPRSKLSKLLLRKIECLIALNRFGSAKKTLEHFVVTIGNEPKDDERVLKIRLQLLHIKTDDDNQKQNNQISLPSTNSMIPVIKYLSRTGRYKPLADLAPVSAKLEPRYSSAKGRHLVAKVDIEPGDILMVESPYTSVLDKEYEFHFCHHCCRRLENYLQKSGDLQGQLCINCALVPCTSCTHVLYCSTVCRTESWRLYHQFECALRPVLYQLDATNNVSIFALRMLLATGLEVIQQVATRNEEEQFKELKLPVLGADPDAASYYEHVYRLLNHGEESLESGVKFSLVSTVALLVQLTKKCGFVRTAEQAKLAGTILLRHLLQLRINTHSILSPKHTEKYFSFAIALGVYPYNSCLLNHSCEPNTVSNWYHGTLLIHRAPRRIVAGTEVTSNYGPYFATVDRTERQKTLLDRYRFVCDCSRCVLEERDGLDGKYYPIGCQKCGSPLTRKSSSSCTFHCSSTSCASKGAKTSLSDVKRLYTRIESQLTSLRNFEDSLCQLVITGGNCTENQLAELERQLTELSNVKGMRNCWNLAEFYYLLADYYELSHYPGTARKARQSFERYCEIDEAFQGISSKLYLHTDRLAGLYALEPITSRFQARHIQRIVIRAIELLRLFSLANLQQKNGPDLLVDGATFLWEEHRELLETLNSLKL